MHPAVTQAAVAPAGAAQLPSKEPAPGKPAPKTAVPQQPAPKTAAPKRQLAETRGASIGPGFGVNIYDKSRSTASAGRSGQQHNAVLLSSGYQAVQYRNLLAGAYYLAFNLPLFKLCGMRPAGSAAAAVVPAVTAAAGEAAEVAILALVRTIRCQRA